MSNRIPIMQALGGLCLSLALCGGLVGTLAGLGGCAANGSGTDTAGGGTNAQRSGIELRRWVVRGQRGQAQRVLGVFADPQAFDDPAEARRWQQGGMIAARVAATDVPALREQLDGIAQERIEWLGVIPEWIPVHRGAQVASDTTVMIDSGPLRVDPGLISLLARAWVVPSLEGSMLRLEMMPQVPVRGAERTGFIDGMPLTRQQLGVTLAAGEALVVFPLGYCQPRERPEARTGPGTAQIGPPTPDWPTLGDLVFVSPTAQPDIAFEQVLVFIASLPSAEPIPSRTTPEPTPPVPAEPTESEPAPPDEQAALPDEPAPTEQPDLPVEPTEPAAPGEPSAGDPVPETPQGQPARPEASQP